MKKVFKVLIAVSIGCVVVPVSIFIKNAEFSHGLTVMRIQGSFYTPKDLQEMTDLSNLIVIGEPKQSFHETVPKVLRLEDGQVSSAHSPTLFKVNRILKGNISSDTITVAENFAIVRNQPNSRPYLWAIDEYQPLIKGRQYILYLQKGLDNGSDYYIAGVYQGKFNIDGVDQSEQKIQSTGYQARKKAVVQKYQQIAGQTP